MMKIRSGLQVEDDEEVEDDEHVWNNALISKLMDQLRVLKMKFKSPKAQFIV